MKPIFFFSLQKCSEVRVRRPHLRRCDFQWWRGRSGAPGPGAPPSPKVARPVPRHCLRHDSTHPWWSTGAGHTFSSSTTPLTWFCSYIISMRAGCITVTGTDLTQTSASGSFKSELDLMHAYSDWASVYTLIRKSWAVRKLRTIIGSAWDSNPGPLALEAGALPLRH